MQEGNGSLAGERGFLHLKTLQKLLRVRQQYMVAQVSLLYPVKLVIGRSHEQELESFTSSIRSGNGSYDAFLILLRAQVWYMLYLLVHSCYRCA